jgi:DNA-binding GntR family transcriptional regulator
MSNKELEKLILKRRKGKGVSVSSVFSDELFSKFHEDAEKQNRSESNLLMWIVSEHYNNYGKK